MTTLRKLMTEWLASGDPSKVAHAQRRLALPGLEAPPTPGVRATIALHRRIAACPHWSRGSVSCGCGTCALGRGDGGRVSTADCTACLNRLLEPSE